MFLIQWVVAVIKSLRFYLWLGLFVAIGFLLRLLPLQVQTTVCSVYTAWIEKPVTEQIDSFFKRATGADAPQAPATGPSTGTDHAQTMGTSPITSEALCQLLRSVACPPTREQPAPSLGLAVAGGGWAALGGELTQVVGGSIVFAMLIMAAIPGQLGAASQQGTRRVEVVAIGSAHFRRNTRLHVGLMYAFGSCVACIVVPPDFAAVEPFSFRAQLPHLMGLVAAALVSGIAGSFRYARTDASCWSVAMQIAFAGVFLSGLIALLIAMPYRVMTSVEAARITLAQLKIFTAIRLIVLPLLAAGGSVGVLAGLRTLYLRTPVRLFPSPVGA